MRLSRRCGVVLGAMLLVVLAGAAAAWLSKGPPTLGRWEVLPEPPLSPREHAVGTWTGEEVVIVGGSDAPPCHPSASCGAPKTPPLRDGAAYNPRTGAWRAIAPAPVGFDFAEGIATVGDVVYVLASGSEHRPGSPRAFLAYNVRTDRWRRLLPPPRRTEEEYALLAAGQRLLAYKGGEVLRYEPGSDAWTRLPSPSFEDGIAQLLWTGSRLAAIGCADGGFWCRARVTLAELPIRDWQRLPDSDVGGLPVWVATPTRLINSQLGAGDSDEFEDDKRIKPGDVPNGGILDLRTRRWSRLPDPPSENHYEGVAVLTADTLHAGQDDNWVFDATQDTWFRIPPLPSHAGTTGDTYVGAGRRLLAFGGARWKATRGTLLNGAAIWHPPN